MEKVCVTHHVTIKTTQDDLDHQRPECIVYETGGGLGEITPVTSESQTAEEGMRYEEGVVMPFETEAEKQARLRGLGLGKPKSS
jgi:hypothetical protein